MNGVSSDILPVYLLFDLRPSFVTGFRPVLTVYCSGSTTLVPYQPPRGL